MSDSVILSIEQAKAALGVSREELAEHPWIQTLTRKIRDQEPEDCVLVPSYLPSAVMVGDQPPY